MMPRLVPPRQRLLCFLLALFFHISLTQGFTQTQPRAFLPSPRRIHRYTNDAPRLHLPRDTLELFAESSSSSKKKRKYVLKDPVMKEAVQFLKRASWVSWWSQVVLTSIAGVILVFATSVAAPHKSSGIGTPNLFLSATGLLTGSLSILWTWGNGARLSRRLATKPASRRTAAHMLRRAVTVGVTLNCVGLLLHLLAAQQIIGSLAVKVLTRGSAGLLYDPTGGAAASTLQPLDVLVVQANTNALLSQFTSLVSLLLVTKQVSKLDPRPAADDDMEDEKGYFGTLRK